MLRAGWLIFAVLVTACGAKTPSLAEGEKKVVMELTMDMKSRCVGRYLIDLPVNVQPIGYARFEEVIVRAQAQTLDQFQSEMREREAALKATKSTLGYQFFFDSGTVRGMKHTRYFVSLGDSGASSDIKRVIEAYKWDRGYQIKLNIDAADSVHAEYAKRYKGTPYGIAEPMNNVPEKTQLAFDLIEKLQGRSDDMIPTEPGSCFAGGFLPGRAVSEEEEIHSYYVMPNLRDVSFSLETFGKLGADDKDTLLKRVSGGNARDFLNEVNGRLIRSGSFELAGGATADEAMMSGLTMASPPVQGHLFSLETNYAGGALRPYLLLDMENGYPNYLVEPDQIKQASLTEGEAIAVWDTVSRTLRPRPNAF